MKRLVILSISAVLALGACDKLTKKDDRVSFDGYFFRAKTKHMDRKDLPHFSVSVQGVSQSLEGALEAGRYQGTTYCINTFGTSDIDWVVGPDTDPAALIVTNDTLNFEGRCKL